MSFNFRKVVLLMAIITCIFLMLVGCEFKEQENEQLVKTAEIETDEREQVDTAETIEKMTSGTCVENFKNKCLDIENIEPIKPIETMVAEIVTNTDCTVNEVEEHESVEEVEEQTKVSEPIEEYTENIVPETPEAQEDLKLETEEKVEAENSNLRSLGNFKLTAYCACSRCCGKSDGITATGTIATQGRTIAVDPSVIPYGTQVVINGNTYIAEDCGGAIGGNRVDIYFNSHQDALYFGVQYAEVFIVSN